MEQLIKAMARTITLLEASTVLKDHDKNEVLAANKKTLKLMVEQSVKTMDIDEVKFALKKQNIAVSGKDANVRQKLIKACVKDPSMLMFDN